jgi:hypothetical protein
VAEVIAGVLSLESSSLATVQVDAGMCLLAPPADEAAPQHPFTGMAAAACNP